LSTRSFLEKRKSRDCEKPRASSGKLNTRGRPKGNQVTPVVGGWVSEAKKGPGSDFLLIFF
jgi:hypothetical protein